MAAVSLTNFAGSDLRFTASGPDIDDIGEAVGVRLPQIPYAASGALRISEEGRFETPGIEVHIAPLDLYATGGIDGYPEFDEIAGYLSFYPARLECFVAGERVRPQPGGFYGGWVTSEIVGPYKGSPGTGGW